ncbi:MAG: nickel-dependent lactate racemase [Peptococcaceae bacterium]|nr:nickel-dependent lactate racemase [Peptococcaceae bacterium]
MAEERVTVEVRYGKEVLQARVPAGSLLFDGKMREFAPLPSFQNALLDRIDRPVGGPPLKEQLSAGDRVMILIDDNTRSTPANKILPVLADYLTENCGVKQENIEIMVATGTHRLMTEDEVIGKVGPEIYKRIKISQHDCRDRQSIVYAGRVKSGELDIPVYINRKILDADYLIGLGSITPHCDAGYSGGSKVVQPGVCGFATTAATHVAAALLDEIPLGVVDNPCRRGIEEVGRLAGLKFIINVVMSPEGGVIGVFAGDPVRAHRKGVELAEQVYGVEIPAPADIVIVSSHPADIDFWQGEKGLVPAYFCVKKGGIIIFVAPCYEGMGHNHPALRDWVLLSYNQAREKALTISCHDEESDLVAFDIAMGCIRAREKARIFSVTSGLSPEDLKRLGFTPFDTLQGAVDYALKQFPRGKIGLLPRGGDCLPLINKKAIPARGRC